MLSSTFVQLVYFDRSGAVECLPVDIHEDAVQLVQIIRLLGDPDLTRLGFDPSMYWENGQRYVDLTGTRPGSRKHLTFKYEVQRVRFQRRPLVQDGMIIWLVKEVGSEERVFMKCIWHLEGSDERGLLAVAQKRSMEGVSNLRLVERTHPTISISSLRRDQCLDGDEQIERSLSRIIIDEYPGPSITKFESGLQMVQALRDAINGTFLFSCFLQIERSFQYTTASFRLVSFIATLRRIISGYVTSQVDTLYSLTWIKQRGVEEGSRFL